MKKLRGAVRAIVIVMACCFLAVGCWMGYTVYTQGARWLTNPYNARLTSARKNVGMGDITDRNGVTLATTDADGNRLYAEDKATRRALSQTVGDQMSMSGTGVETFHAGTLLGLSGSIIDRTWQYVTGGNYQGDNIRLTVDAALTTYAAQEFPDRKEGAVVVLNYKNGEILCMVSSPGYDSAKLANRQSGDDVSGSGYLNRCLQGQYAPGSVFKIVTLASALSYIPGIEDMVFVCDGPRAFGQGKVTCYGGEVHGEMTLKKAFAKSCNVTFASIARALGSARLAATAKQMGFNDNFNFRDVVLYESSIPEDITDESELAWTGDGQGKLIVTPMHMAMIAAAVANDGVMPSPKLIAQVTGVGGIPRLRAAEGAYGRVMSVQHAQTIGKYMNRAVEAGTATKAAIKGFSVCGKTGTAETSDDKRVENNAWFVGYVDDDRYPYAVAVVVEQGGTGGMVAAPFAAKVLKKAISLEIP